MGSVLIRDRQLDVSFNLLRKIEGLERLTKLKKLFLLHNKITNISNLEHLTGLQMLELGSNRIRVSDETRPDFTCLIIQTGLQTTVRNVSQFWPPDRSEMMSSVCASFSSHTHT